MDNNEEDIKKSVELNSVFKQLSTNEDIKYFRKTSNDEANRYMTFMEEIIKTIGNKFSIGGLKTKEILKLCVLVNIEFEMGIDDLIIPALLIKNKVLQSDGSKTLDERISSLGELTSNYRQVNEQLTKL